MDYICEIIFWFQAVISHQYSLNGIFFSNRLICVFNFWRDQSGSSLIDSVVILIWSFNWLVFWFPWFCFLHYSQEMQHLVCKILWLFLIHRFPFSSVHMKFYKRWLPPLIFWVHFIDSVHDYFIEIDALVQESFTLVIEVPL